MALRIALAMPTRADAQDVTFSFHRASQQLYGPVYDIVRALRFKVATRFNLSTPPEDPATRSDGGPTTCTDIAGSVVLQIVAHSFQTNRAAPDAGSALATFQWPRYYASQLQQPASTASSSELGCVGRGLHTAVASSKALSANRPSRDFQQFPWSLIISDPLRLDHYRQRHGLAVDARAAAMR